MKYNRFLGALHARHLFNWYLEIGCRSGASIAPVRSKTVAVDPFFRANINIIGKKPALHVIQATSDEFFASDFLKRNDIRLAISFLDGMHLFEYLLRDFIGTEAASDPNAVIIVHDCVPWNVGMTTRDLTAIRGPWTGDVWKLIPILQAYRPDLKLTMLDCHPTGLLCVSNLSPGNCVLSENYDAIVSDFMGTDIEGFGVARYFELFDYFSALDEMERGFPLFTALALDPGCALKPLKLST